MIMILRLTRIIHKNDRDDDIMRLTRIIYMNDKNDKNNTYEW